MPNPVMQFQILSSQPDVTAAFYQDLFDWQITTDNAIGYRQIRTNSGEGIEGGIWPAPPNSPPATQIFIAVDDIEAKAAAAQAKGAKLLIPPTTLPDGDSIAVLLDPLGLPFALWKRPA